MPLGPYATFGECVGAQKRKGHSDESAHRICGALEQQSASSQVQKQGAAYNNMSFPPKQEQEKKPEEGGKIEMSMEQGEALANAVMNLPPSPEAETAQKIITDIMDIEQEQTDPPGPPR